MKKDNHPTPESETADGGAVTIQELETLALPEEAWPVIERLLVERDEATEGRFRALADFRNFQRRSLENEARALDRGVMNVVRSLLPVMDQFGLVLGQDAEHVTVEQLQGGVDLVRDELNRALADHGVEPIIPERGDEFDPNRHEAMMRQPTQDLDDDQIVAVIQSGYGLGDLMLRPAKVIVAERADAATDAPAESS